jgi:hypothetical protein
MKHKYNVGVDYASPTSNDYSVLAIFCETHGEAESVTFHSPEIAKWVGDQLNSHASKEG